MANHRSSKSIPFAEPPWLNGLPSLFYKASHHKWQATCRSFIEENLGRIAIESQRAGKLPHEVYAKFGASGFLIPNLPAPLPVEFLKSMGIHELPGGLKLYRCGLWGPAGAIIPGVAFGAPPLYKFGNKSIQERFLPGLLRGTKRSCIAITEPGAGSDVANIETTAKRTNDGMYYRVDGAKKWISNGIWADFATMAVRTGGPGPTGISLLVVPLKNTSGVTCRQMAISAGGISGTTYIELDNVLVPVENLLGTEGHGFKYVLTNFNHERLGMAISGTVQARAVLSTAFNYVTKREAFGRPLIDQAVVRHRLAKCGSELEAQWAWVEQLVHSMTQLSKAEADAKLSSLTALAKVRAGRVLQKCVDSAQLLLGGNSVTLSGQGELIEMIAREVALNRIPGGSEDVLLDLSIRQMLKQFNENPVPKL